MKPAKAQASDRACSRPEAGSPAAASSNHRSVSPSAKTSRHPSPGETGQVTPPAPLPGKKTGTSRSSGSFLTAGRTEAVCVSASKLSMVPGKAQCREDKISFFNA